ncbi:hypothetical protein [uncultured Pseudoteredinibacter sp.]|uniref:hypothetical protein n=1 Tax=uncultured Pseudoteredinibacter sp. TaxID=1641701 RepID=UPI0026330996|nr:hypothetical protein [uncultured Pseudoteredinibacter sp.]
MFTAREKIIRLLSTAIPGIIIIGFLGYYYSFLIDTWWMFDDSQHVKKVALDGLRVFTTPAEELGMIPANFTPWLLLNYWIDFKIGGLDPTTAHIHQIISVSVCGLAIYGALSRWMPTWLAASFCLFFLTTPASYTVIQILCTRHYVEGLLYSCLSVILLKSFIENGGYWRLIFSATLYFVACLNKEVYVPLFGFFTAYLAYIAVKRQSWSVFYYLAPFIIIVLIYIPYRGYALGWDRLISGYGSKIDHQGFTDVIDFFTRIINFNHFKGLMYFYVILIFASLVTAFRAEKIRTLSIFMVGASLVVGVLVPAYPVMPTARVNYNYTFVAVFVLLLLPTLWACILCNSKNLRLFTNILLASTFSFSTYKNVTTYNPQSPLAKANFHRDIFKRTKVEGEAILYEEESFSILKPTGAKWHHAGLYDIREKVLQSNPGPKACYALCDCPKEQVVFAYADDALTQIETETETCQ